MNSLHLYGTPVFGKLSVETIKPQALIQLGTQAICTPFGQHTTSSSSSSPPLRQFTRVTVIVDELPEAQALHASNEVLKAFDLVAVTPGTTYVMLCFRFVLSFINAW